VRIAYDALQRRLAAEPQKRRLIDGLTPEQRFFISYAQIWRQVIREQELKRRLTVDPHSPGKFRGTIPVVTHPDFPKVFNNGKLSQQADPSNKDISVW
jgi:Predicted metalloendopeptidase